MHKWMASAAGGTNQRLNPGPAIVRSLSQKLLPASAMHGSLRYRLLTNMLLLHGVTPSPSIPVDTLQRPIALKHAVIQKLNAAMQKQPNSHA